MKEHDVVKVAKFLRKHAATVYLGMLALLSAFILMVITVSNVFLMMGPLSGLSIFISKN